jgi:hypothetical protein
LRWQDVILSVDVDVVVLANLIVAALGNGNDIVGVGELAWTRCGRQIGPAGSWSQLTSK